MLQGVGGTFLHLLEALSSHLSSGVLPPGKPLHTPAHPTLLPRPPACTGHTPDRSPCSTALQGLPVFYAPGEAEAVCAALNRAGCVDAAASSDSDTLLYGAETLLQSLKLSVRRKAGLVGCAGAPGCK